MSWQLSDWDLVWCFLKLYDLLIDELALLMDYNVRIHGALGISRHFLSVTDSRERHSSKTTSDGQNSRVMAVSALDVEGCGLGGQD